MPTTRIELAIEQMETDDTNDEYSCDDLRTAWLCAELARSRTGVKGGFDAVWLDR